METRLIRFFKKELYKRYHAFLQQAILYFPNHKSLQLAQSKEPDFNVLIQYIFAARDSYCGYKQESLLLCEKIAAFSALYCNIVNSFRDGIDDEYMYKNEFEQSLIKYVRFQFAEEIWIHDIMYCIDMDTLISYIMGTNRYASKEDVTVDCVRTIVAYTIQSTKDVLISTYIKQMSLRLKRGTQNNIYCDIDEYNVQISQKNPPKTEAIIIEVGKKKLKNKRKISEQKKLKAVLQRGESFTISLSPVMPTAGIKRIVIKDSLESVMEFIEANISEKTTIVRDSVNVKILFAEKVSNSQYKR